MRLKELLAPWLTQVPVDCQLTDLSNDTRSIQSGDVFLAYPGAVTDGRLYIDKAFSLGAAAVIYDPNDCPIDLPSQFPCIALPDLKNELAPLAARFYEHPSQSLNVTGVTGTNGKTTIAYQLAQAHHLLGRRAAYMGTIGQGEVEDLSPLENTTPDALCLQRLLRQYQDRAIQEVCMEVSSHALSQHRVDLIHFKQALFTNLSLDHLDYHQTMEAYSAAKARLFAYESLQTAIINQDDDYQMQMKAALHPHVQIISYGKSPESDVRLLSWESELGGSLVGVDSPWGALSFRIQTFGEYNIYNSLAILSSLLYSGYSVQSVLDVLPTVHAAPGRMELVARSPYVLVDYAHTPDALEKSLITLRQLQTTGQLWVVFGCGGDRDKSKRPIMGKVASRYADKVVITSDNPRSEDAQSIIDEIVAGCSSSATAIGYIDRREALETVLKAAAAEDLILVAGKGHEAYQQIGQKKYPFSDQAVIRAAIQHTSLK